MYWDDCTESIVSNMRNLGKVDHSREFPSPYHYLLYSIFATISYWIEDSTRLKPSLESVRIDKIDIEPGNVAKSAVISLGTCLNRVVSSSNVTPEFKGYLLTMVLSRYEDVAKHDNRPCRRSLS